LKDSEIEKIKNEVLGKQYELSFAFISKNKIKSLNKKYRKKDEPTDILSFDLSNPSIKNSGQVGEIFICPEVAKTKAPKFGLTYKKYLIFLVIHGMLHLKGLSHGVKMERYELTHYSRYRCRHL